MSFQLAYYVFVPIQLGMLLWLAAIKKKGNILAIGTCLFDGFAERHWLYNDVRTEELLGTKGNPAKQSVELKKLWIWEEGDGARSASDQILTSSKGV
ncbi:hypothetical protein F8388_008227 [Cannabis sativa]|uniref:Uncharacterized protein n=1 Tax=Cannabis sativa TaxID=3483 RepID=A0A7J6EV93_CANSA|nr:hypothetical protein F8388_008227 [Cannabis sativa]